MKMRVIGLFLVILGIALVFSFEYIGFVTQGDVSSSVTIVDVVEEPEEEGGSSGGGGAARIRPPDFIVLDKNFIQASIEQGEGIQEVVTVTNEGQNVITIDSIIIEGVNHLVSTTQPVFTLAPGQSKQVLFSISAHEDEVPDSYVGTITLIGENIEESIDVLIEVSLSAPVFDVRTSLAKNKLIPGENVVAEIDIIRVEEFEGSFEIDLYYAIRDFDGNAIVFRNERVRMQEDLHLVRQLNVPADIVLGRYDFYVRASTSGSADSSSESFEVVSIVLAPIVENNFVLILAIVVALLVLFFIFFLWKRRRKENKPATSTRTSQQGVIYVGKN